MLVELGAGVSNSAIVSVLWTLSSSLFATSFPCHATRDPIVEEIKKCKHKVKKMYTTIADWLWFEQLVMGSPSLWLKFTCQISNIHCKNQEA